MEKPYDPEEALKLDNQLCFPLYAAARRIVGSYTPFLRPLGITYTQYITFLLLWEKDGITVGEICRRLYLDSGTVTPMLKKMEYEGYVTRQRSEDDERRVTVFLTDQGKELKKKAEEIPRKIGGCISLSGEDAQSLYRILYEILNNGCAGAEEPEKRQKAGKNRRESGLAGWREEPGGSERGTGPAGTERSA